MKAIPVFAIVILGIAAAQAQVATGKPSVRAIGDATIMSIPDQAKVSFAVETRAATAQDAAAQNAAITTAVIAALKSVIGSGGDVQTTGYSLNAVYTYPPNGGQGQLSGFAASNTVQGTLTNLAQVGKLIDVGVQAGATQVQSLVFSLKDPEPVRLQALRQAAILARTHADAMANGASLKVGTVLSIIEGATSTPIVYSNVPTAAATTPIVPGNVTTTATVTMEFEIVQ